MDLLINFVKSDTGIVIAWLCSVVSFSFSIFKSRENKLLKYKLITLRNLSVRISGDEVSQNGGNNVYTKNNSGGMNIKM